MAGRKVVNESMQCFCGCGRQTNNIYSRYIAGHEKRKSPVDYIVDENGCWVWQLAINKHGYGSMRVGKTNLGAHRIYYERYKGPIPEGLQIDHLCRNRACVNPDHLEAVTVKENIHRGNLTRFRADARAEMARLYRETDLTQYGIAALFGTNQGTVHDVLAGEGVKGDERKRARGERGGNSKLNDAKVREIRKLHAGGATYAAIGEQFGVSGSTIAHVVTGSTWGHVS